MRKILNKYLIDNQEYLKNKIVFLHNDLWSFNSKDLDFVEDLNVCENSIWSYAYGQYLSGKLPIVYGVSFFQIGRLETLRKFFGYNKAPILIFNAGSYGYDKYGWEHCIKDNEDISLMRELNFLTIDQNNIINIQQSIRNIFNEFIKKKKNIYIKLQKDI